MGIDVDERGGSGEVVIAGPGVGNGGRVLWSGGRWATGYGCCRKGRRKIRIYNVTCYCYDIRPIPSSCLPSLVCGTAVHGVRTRCRIFMPLCFVPAVGAVVPLAYSISVGPTVSAYREIGGFPVTAPRLLFITTREFGCGVVSCGQDGIGRGQRCNACRERCDAGSKGSVVLNELREGSTLRGRRSSKIVEITVQARKSIIRDCGFVDRRDCVGRPKR